MSKRILAAAITLAVVILVVVLLFILLKEPIIEQLYPMEYEQLVEKYAQDNGIEPTLVYAVI
jgi:soluble lytic murein transglycosylase